MRKNESDVFSEILLIVAGFILAETIIRQFLNLADGTIASWVLPLFAIGTILYAIELRNGKSETLAGWAYWFYIASSIILIVFLNNGKISQLNFLLIELSGAIIILVLWILQVTLLNDKKK